MSRSIKSTSEALLTASQKFAEVLYQRTQTTPDQGPAQAAPGDDDVVDAEVVEEGEEKSA